jgi:hypothetical protein
MGLRHMSRWPAEAGGAGVSSVSLVKIFRAIGIIHADPTWVDADLGIGRGFQDRISVGQGDEWRKMRMILSA